ncbi:MAG TPA: hypothetical protein VI072_03070 [Polyangiaceae bacterium]
MAKLNPKQLAQQTALQGDVDGAVQQLSTLFEGGDPAAAASLAQIEAFRGQWSEMLRHASAFMRKPSAAHTGNVVTETVNLMALAAIQAGDWADIHAEAVAIRKHLLGDKQLKQYASGDDPSGLDQLIDFAKSKGQSPYVWDWGNYSELDAEERAAKVDAVIFDKVAQHKKKKLFDDDADRRRHFFALASKFGSHRTAVRLFDEDGVGDLITFDPIAFAASALARAGRSDDAWQVVERAVRIWWPVDVAQVAPVDLLTDEGLRPLMTPDRCEWVLRTPRGPAAAPKKEAKAKAKK